MSWEGLEVLTIAHRRLRAEEMLMLMVACQGDGDSWKRQAQQLKKLM